MQTLKVHEAKTKLSAVLLAVEQRGETFPNMIQYIVMPITGVLTCAYSLLQLFGKDLRRYHTIEEEIKRDA